MRCSFRRWIKCLVLTSLLTILYRLYKAPNEPRIISPSLFKIITIKNHTYRILSSSFRYDPSESYLNFAYFNVEQRSRVLHIDYQYDIPVSSQWKSTGHLYPIQIAQFGLSHWSRWKQQAEIEQKPVYKFEKITPNNFDRCSSWNLINSKILLSDTFIYFTISANCSLHIRFLDNNIELIYSTMTSFTSENLTQVIIPLKGCPRHVNRYMLIDITKSISKSLLFKSDRIEIRVCGQSSSFVKELVIGNQTLYNQQAFYAATNWLFHNQDLKTGCWFIHINRTFGRHHQHRIRIPWCSAMAQGQAASLFVRLYSVTRNVEHLLAIRRAIQPLWSSNISRAYFHNQYVWLEEYPLESSTEGLFVLNGCLYALLGLIDVNTIDFQPYVLHVINEILNSLDHMLPYYIHSEEQYWSLYDLSHITMKSKINVASDSYHVVHIILLQCLSQVFNLTSPSVSQLFDSYARKFLSAISYDRI